MGVGRIVKWSNEFGQEMFGIQIRFDDWSEFGNVIVAQSKSSPLLFEDRGSAELKLKQICPDGKVMYG